LCKESGKRADARCEEAKWPRNETNDPRIGVSMLEAELQELKFELPLAYAKALGLAARLYAGLDSKRR